MVRGERLMDERVERERELEREKETRRDNTMTLPYIQTEWSSSLCSNIKIRCVVNREALSFSSFHLFNTVNTLSLLFSGNDKYISQAMGGRIWWEETGDIKTTTEKININFLSQAALYGCVGFPFRCFNNLSLPPPIKSLYDPPYFLKTRPLYFSKHHFFFFSPHSTIFPC